MIDGDALGPPDIPPSPPRGEAAAPVEMEPLPPDPTTRRRGAAAEDEARAADSRPPGKSACDGDARLARAPVADGRAAPSRVRLLDELDAAAGDNDALRRRACRA